MCAAPTIRRRTGAEKFKHSFTTLVNSESHLERNESAVFDEMSGSRDRTKEFLATVKSLNTNSNKQLSLNGNVNGRLPLITEKYEMYREFSRISKLIGKDIATTCTKLEKLTVLARRKTIFDDRQSEIQELTCIIKQDITGLHRKISDLQSISQTQRGVSKTIMSHSNNVVTGLRSRLATMSVAFKTVLEVRTENMKHQKTRREQFSSSNHSALAGSKSSPSLLLDARGSSINIDMPDGGHQTQDLLLMDRTDDYIKERASTMESIESTIVELGQIFQQLAHMVKEQEEVVQRIDSNVEETELNVEAAHTEILKYFQSISSNRWLIIKVFGILVVFFIIFIVFFA